MREEVFFLISLGLFGFLVLVTFVGQPVAIALMTWAVSRAQTAEARRLEAQNEADRLRLALAEQEKGHG